MIFVFHNSLQPEVRSHIGIKSFIAFFTSNEEVLSFVYNLPCNRWKQNVLYCFLNQTTIIFLCYLPVSTLSCFIRYSFFTCLLPICTGYYLKSSLWTQLPPTPHQTTIVTQMPHNDAPCRWPLAGITLDWKVLNIGRLIICLILPQSQHGSLGVCVSFDVWI